MAIIAQRASKANSTKSQVKDILVDVSWRAIANNYFSKSASWFYQRMNGVDGNGKETDFTAEERLQLKGALVDLSERIRRAADNITITE